MVGRTDEETEVFIPKATTLRGGDRQKERNKNGWKLCRRRMNSDSIILQKLAEKDPKAAEVSKGYT